MSNIVMPRLSDTMEEGTILRWLKSNGEALARGEELVEIETDKATMVYESDQAGILQITAPEGATLAVGEPIALVQQPGAENGALESIPHGPATPTDEAPQTIGGQPPAPAPGAVSPTPAASRVSSSPTPEEEGVRVKASPLARRVALESGVDLRGLSGSGPGGRIVRADVPARGPGASAGAPPTAAPPEAGSGATGPAAPAPAAATQPAAAEPAAGALSTAKGATTTIELSRTQQTIARRMAESKATIPDFTLQVEVDMENCVALRGELKRLSRPDLPPSEGQPPPGAPTYNDMIVKASALALREHPRANGSYRDGRLQLHSRVNVGVAVASQDALLVPTVFDADEKSLGEIARETRTLAERVREQTITPPQLGGGTFTVSNLGMYGVRSFTAIVNPPQAGILSVGALESRALVRDGEVVVRATVALTLVCDHRILYGADAALFLARVRELLESPSALTL